MNGRRSDNLTDRFVEGLDSLAVPRRATPQFARRESSGFAWSALAVAALVIFALVLTLQPDGERAAAPGASASPGVPATATPTVAPVVPTLGKGEPSPSPTPVDLRNLRVLWMHVPARQSIVLQEEDRAGAVSEMRLVRRTDGAEVARAPVRAAVPGEPRVCGLPDVVPPLVAAIPEDPAVLADLRAEGEPRVYQLQVRKSGGEWHTVELLNWARLAGGPCWE